MPYFLFVSFNHSHQATKDVATPAATHSVPLGAVTQDALIGKGAGSDEALVSIVDKSTLYCQSIY